MYLSESFRIWRKRRYLTAALLVLALAGSGAALSTLPRTYQANSSVILLASRTAASPYGGNPYLSFSPSLTLAADAVSRELMGPRTLDVRQAHDPLDTPTTPDMRWPPRRAGTRRPAVRARGPRQARRPARRGRDDGWY